MQRKGSSSEVQLIRLQTKLTVLFWFLGLSIPILGTLLGIGSSTLLQISERLGEVASVQSQVNRIENNLITHLNRHELTDSYFDNIKIVKKHTVDSGISKTVSN